MYTLVQLDAEEGQLHMTPDMGLSKLRWSLGLVLPHELLQNLCIARLMSMHWYLCNNPR